MMDTHDAVTQKRKQNLHIQKMIESKMNTVMYLVD